MERKSPGLLVLLLIMILAFNVGPLEKYTIVSLFIVFLFKRKFKIRANKGINAFVLFLWGLTYYIMFIAEGNDIFAGLVYFLIGPLTMYYCVDFYIHSSSPENREKNLFKILTMISLCLYLHGLIDIVYSIQHGYFTYSSELVYDVVTAQNVNRTIIGLYLTPSVCIGVPALLIGQGNMKPYIRLILSSVAISSVLLSIYLGNRSLIVIFAALFILTILLGMQTKSRKWLLCLTFVLLIVAGVMIWNNKLWNIRGFISTSFLSKRIQAGQVENPRLSIYAEIFENFTDYLLGWVTASATSATISLSSAHNIWLDCFIYAGILPAILLVIYSVRVFKDSLRAFSKCSNPLVCMITLCFAVGIMLNWAVEPVLYADPYYFAICCGCFSGIETLKKHIGDCWVSTRVANVGAL